MFFLAAIMYVASGFGVTGGAHRLWTHKAYKVKLPLKLFLLMCYSSAGQVHIFSVLIIVIIIFRSSILGTIVMLLVRFCGNHNLNSNLCHGVMGDKLFSTKLPHLV